MHLKMFSAEVVCCKKLCNITDKLSIEANSMDPEQTAPIQSNLGSHCLPYRLIKHFSRREKQTTFVVIGAVRVKSPETIQNLSNNLGCCVNVRKIQKAVKGGQQVWSASILS